MTTAPRTHETLAYMPQLDSLRTIAVAGVFVTHFVHFESALLDSFEWGYWGVQLFFVLSGFLITGILLKCRKDIEEQRLTVSTGLLHFYGRRLLRLMPIYMLTLAVMLAINPKLWQHIHWYVMYLQNILFSLRGRHHTPDPALNHFWTLAVEEQFYLTWPLLIFVLPRRALTAVLVGIIFLPIVFRLSMLLAGMEWVEVRMLTPAQLDTLGFGALLAVLHHATADGVQKARRLTNALLGPGIVLGVVYLVCKYVNQLHDPNPVIPNGFLLLLSGLVFGPVFMWVIHRAAIGFTGVTGAVLQFKPLIYLGKISYGLYVYHNVVPLMLRRHGFPWFNLSEPQNNFARFGIYAGATIVVAMASWHLIERPLQGLKKYLRY